ncbi:hypothetical protein BYT27DRAFT_7250138 [Phlegmacium glaucopus]|nr:hypothetical protein BYT27DRAFT_7250138 [Phlegmacium glaucopus]
MSDDLHMNLKGKNTILPNSLASPKGITTYGQYLQLVVQSLYTLTTARHLERCINAPLLNEIDELRPQCLCNEESSESDLSGESGSNTHRSSSHRHCRYTLHHYYPYHSMIIFTFSVLLARHAFAQDFILVDDQDPRVKYGGGTNKWIFKSRAEQFNATAMLTRSAGATATLLFNGTAISVYGRIDTPDENSTVSTYAINNGVPVVFDAPHVPTILFNELFYSSPVLSPGEQTLTITNLHDNAWFYLDYFNITMVHEASIANPSSVQPSSVQPSIATSTGVQVSSKKGITAGVAVGITLGVICFLVIVILCYIWLQKRRSRIRNVSPLEDNPKDLATHRTGSVTSIRSDDVVQPFLVPAASTEPPHPKTLMSSLPSSSAPERPINSVMSQVNTSHLLYNGGNEIDASTLPPPYNATI